MKINKKNLILLIALVVIIVALVAISSLNKKTINTGSQVNSTTKNQNTKVADQTNNANQAVDVTSPANGQNVALVANGTGTELTATPLAPGVSPATSGTPVANQNFAPVNPTVTSNNPAVIASLSSMPGSPEAPKQEVVAADKIPATAIKLSVSDSGFSPKEFTIKSGQEVSLAITAVGSSTHVFIFPIASLMGLQTMVSNEETKVITFTAPDPGQYGFRDDIPSFRMNTGTMIVE